MARLYSFFGLNEMARPKGTFGKTMRAALEKAREYGREFTVKQFCGWLAEQGVENPHPASVGIRLSKMVAGEGERPNTLQPLVKAQAGRRGPGGSGTFLYALNGPAGYTKPDPNAASSDDDGEEQEFNDDDDSPAPVAPRKPAPRWVPQADPNGDWTEETMAELEGADLGPDHPMWLKVGEAENDMAVAKIIGAENIPTQYRRKVQRISKKIFSNLGKDWETGNVPAARPANTSAGDRKYDKAGAANFTSKKGDAKHATDKDAAGDVLSVGQSAGPDKGMAAFLAAMSKPVQAQDDDDDFIEPDDEPAADEPEATQAGASQFLTPASPTPPPPQAQRGGPAPPPSASKPNAKNMSQLMKRFAPKR